MAVEIERKFLVDHAVWTPAGTGTLHRQGYLSTVKERVVRVRVAGDEAFLTIKGLAKHISRLEFEYPIPLDDAATLLNQLCERPPVEKTRYQQRVGNHIWVVDVFHGDNDGLIVAEIELTSEAETFERPRWVGQEVSGDPRYFNANLSINPYKTWRGRGDRG
jgi:adenylate cyclase